MPRRCAAVTACVFSSELIQASSAGFQRPEPPHGRTRHPPGPDIGPAGEPTGTVLRARRRRPVGRAPNRLLEGGRGGDFWRRRPPIGPGALQMMSDGQYPADSSREVSCRRRTVRRLGDGEVSLRRVSVGWEGMLLLPAMIAMLSRVSIGTCCWGSQQSRRPARRCKGGSWI